MEDEDEVDILGDFCLNLETDLNHYDSGEFPTQNNELLGDYMQHPWLLDNSQVWYFDHSADDKGKTVLENMLQEEKKHFPSGSAVPNPSAVVSAPVSVSKVSPIWTGDDVNSLQKGIELHGQNWSKVARIVGTKTTLQVKSYVKSRPELLSAAPQPTKAPPSPPPHFLSQVEIKDHFSVDDIVDEAEIPASFEEVIASVTTGGWPANRARETKSTRAPRAKHLLSRQPHSRSKSKLGPGPRKTVAGRPRKSEASSAPTGAEVAPRLPPPGPPLLELKKNVVPLLQGEIIRLRKESIVSDTDSNSDVDIGDDECGQKKPKMAAQPLQPLPPSTVSPAPPPTPPVPVHHEEIVAAPSPTPIAAEGDSSEAEAAPVATEPPTQPVFKFAQPVEERHVDLNTVSDEERLIHWDFFEGRPSKTPERYAKIRNSIVHEWRRVRPRYLTKTSVRPALKNCGDVNCISRIHAYLELIGAINFGCEQVQYDRPLPPVPSHRERLVAGGGASSTLTGAPASGWLVRARKKRQHPPTDAAGSCSHDNSVAGGGYTIRHDGTVQMPTPPAQRKPSAPAKGRPADPFQLVPCIAFGTDRSAPFHVELSPQVLAVIDVHSHLCTTEVIGLLGGRYSASAGTLVVEAAQPCRSLSTGHQCEMCPVSQTEGSEQLRSQGLEIVGWYHSHPTFPALPSLRDVHTQGEFQQWFSRQEAPFVGLIVNPFSSSGRKSCPSLKSMIRCLTVHDDLPYKHDVTVSSKATISLQQVRQTLDVLGRALVECPTLVPLDKAYPNTPVSAQREQQPVTYASKALLSLRAHLDKVVAASEMDSLAEMVTGLLHQLTPHKN